MIKVTYSNSNYDLLFYYSIKVIICYGSCSTPITLAGKELGKPSHFCTSSGSDILNSPDFP